MEGQRILSYNWFTAISITGGTTAGWLGPADHPAFRPLPLLSPTGQKTVIGVFRGGDYSYTKIQGHYTDIILLLVQGGERTVPSGPCQARSVLKSVNNFSPEFRHIQSKEESHRKWISCRLSMAPSF